MFCCNWLSQSNQIKTHDVSTWAFRNYWGNAYSSQIENSHYCLPCLHMKRNRCREKQGTGFKVILAAFRLQLNSPNSTRGANMRYFLKVLLVVIAVSFFAPEISLAN